MAKIEKKVEYGHCRKCTKDKKITDFYTTSNPMIDTNGYLSVCKSCCNDLYEKYFSIYNNMDVAIDLTCQCLDLAYSRMAISHTQGHIRKLIEGDKKADNVFGYYKSKLSSINLNRRTGNELRYKDSDSLEEVTSISNGDDQGYVPDDVVQFWGRGKDVATYSFLENELAHWKETYACDNRAELILLREICIKQCVIREKQEKGEPYDKDLDQLQNLMKTCSVDPAKANMASAGKMQEALGMWIKDIEQLRPAEWYDQQDKYVDMDGFKKYISDYIVRPIKNFMTGSRDFQLSEIGSLDDEEGDS
jgi:hypothetical protein